MSIVALTLVLGSVFGDLAKYGAIVRQEDEAALAHLWQLLMVGQLPVLGFFALKWLPKIPRIASAVLGLQIGAALASVATVFFLHL